MIYWIYCDQDSTWGVWAADWGRHGCLSMSRWGQEGTLGGSTPECECFEVKQGPGDPAPHHRASPRSLGEEQGPASAPQHNISVFTLDIEKPLNGKETCALPRRHASGRRPHSAAFVRGRSVKLEWQVVGAYTANFLAFISCAAQMTIFNPKCFLPFPAPPFPQTRGLPP